jgi:uncharacterized protein YacL
VGDQEGAVSDGTRRGGDLVVELVRLAVVVILTAAGFAAGERVDQLVDRADPESTRLLTSVLGALLGYLLGGTLGRRLVVGVDAAQQRLQRVDSSVLIAAAIGATLGATFGIVLTLPVMLLPARAVTIPSALVVVLIATYAGGRLGAARGGDLSRYIGVRGRLEVASPSRGGGTKLIDSSALIDARIVDIARAGFLEGTLVVPRFVLEEVQAMADVEDRRRRTAARRGLDALKVLGDERVVTVEVTDDDVPGVHEVDAKLAALCRERSAALVTTDSGLARVAEIAGVRVLNVHVLAEALRPPVIPGERMRVQIVRQGTEAGQGVGYLSDGSMVVVERAAPHEGAWVAVDVTSITQTNRGRMLFGSLVEEPV